MLWIGGACFAIDNGAVKGVFDIGRPVRFAMQPLEVGFVIGRDQALGRFSIKIVDAEGWMLSFKR